MNMGLLEIDADPAANRYSVFDRNTLRLITQKEVPPNNQVKCLISVQQALDGVLVMIIDDDGEYNAKALDGVTAPLVDSHTINLGY
jgi:hypothetical protein